MVTRYDLQPLGWMSTDACHMQRATDGDYVTYDDYAALEAERDALKAEIANLRALLLSDAAVERGCAVAAARNGYLWPTPHEAQNERVRLTMRAALVAALTPEAP